MKICQVCNEAEAVCKILMTDGTHKLSCNRCSLDMKASRPGGALCDFCQEEPVEVTLTGADGAPVQRCGKSACKKAATERLEHAAQRSAKQRKLAASETALHLDSSGVPHSSGLESPRRAPSALAPPPLPPPLELSSISSSGGGGAGVSGYSSNSSGGDSGDAANKIKAQRLKLAEQNALIESQMHALEQQREGAKISGVPFPDENAKHLQLLSDARRTLDEKIARFQSHVAPTKASARGDISGGAQVQCAICLSTPVVGALGRVSFCVECLPSSLSTCDKCGNVGKNYRPVSKNGKDFHFCPTCIEAAQKARSTSDRRHTFNGAPTSLSSSPVPA